MLSLRNQNWFKFITVAVACLFLTDISWSLPPKDLLIDGTSLQVQSMFSPITEMIGGDYGTQARLEMTLILAMVLRDNKITFQDINASLDKWYSAVRDKEKSRVLNVLSNPRRQNGSVVIDLEVFSGSQKSRRFRIVSSSESVDDIPVDEAEIRVEEMPSDVLQRLSPAAEKGPEKSAGENAAEALIRNIPRESMENKVCFMDILAGLIRDLPDAQAPDIKDRSTRAILFFIETGVISREDVVSGRLLDDLITNLNNRRRSMRGISSRVLRAFVESGLVDKKEIARSLSRDALLSGLDEQDSETCVDTAEAIKHLVKAGIIDREELIEHASISTSFRKGSFLRPLMALFKDRSSNTQMAGVKIARYLIEAGLADRGELKKGFFSGVPLMRTCFLDGLVDMLVNSLKDIGEVSEESAELIKFLIETGQVSREEIRKKTLRDMVLRRKPWVSSVLEGAKQTGNMYMRRLSTRVLTTLVEAGLIDNREEILKEDGILDMLTEGLGYSESSVCLRSAEAITAIIREGLIQDREELARTSLVHDFIHGLSDQNGHMRVRYAKGIRTLVERGLVDREEVEEKVPLDMLISDISDIRGGASQTSAETLKILIEAGVIKKEAIGIELLLDRVFDGLTEAGTGLHLDFVKIIMKILAEAGIVKRDQVKDRLPLGLLSDGMGFLPDGLRGSGNVCVESAEAIGAFFQAGLVTREELRGIPFLDIFTTGLKNESRDIRVVSTKAIATFTESGFLSPAGYAMTGFKETERIFRELYGKQLPPDFFHFYLRLLARFKDDYAVLKKIDRYLTPGLLELSRIDGDIFYDEFFPMIAKDMSPRKTEAAIGEIMLKGFSRGMEKGEAVVPLFARRAGRLAASMLKTRERIPEAMASVLKLFDIGFRDGGDTFSTEGVIAGSCMQELPPVEFEKVPAAPPEFRSRKVSRIPEKNFTPLAQLLKGAEFYKKIGRTLVYKTRDGKYAAFKFLKTSVVSVPAEGGRRVKREDPGTLVHESEYFGYLNELKNSGVDLRGDYPMPVFIDGERTIRIRTGDVPESMNTLLRQGITEPAKPGRKDLLDTAGGRYTLMAYTTDNPDYFTYLHEIPDEGRTEAAQKNVHDLFVLARCGLVHPDIVELFHNIFQSGRGDEGRYIWTVDAAGAMAGAGRLHSWENAVNYPNMRLSGPADFAEMIRLRDLIDLSNPHSAHLQHDLQSYTAEKRAGFLLAHFMGNYFLGWALAEGKRLKQEGKLDSRNCGALAKTAREVYSSAFRAFAGSGDEDITELVDWDRFARQMAFFMGGEYRDYVKKDIPEEITGIPHLRITVGDGWGWIHKDLITDAIQAVPGLRHIDEREWEKYFFHARFDTIRRVPEGVLGFDRNFEKDIESEKNALLAGVLKKLYAEYSTGWRFNGRDEDLGPVNGPNPLTELIRANYVYTMTMLGRYVAGPRIDDPSPAPGAGKTEGTAPPDTEEGPDLPDRGDKDSIRQTEKLITDTGTRSRQVFFRIRSYLDGIQEDVKTGEPMVPVDVVIDLSLIPADDINENMETWAYLILSCHDMENINFIFEVPDGKGKAGMPDPLRRDIKNAADVTEAVTLLREMIKEKAVLFDIYDAGDAERLTYKRINAGRRDNAVEIPMISRTYLEWVRDSDMELEPNQYPVALDGMTDIAGEGVALRNFEAALTIGLTKAALVIARRRDDEKREDEEKELPELKKKLLERLRRLYSVFREDVIITGETIDHMIDPSPAVRMNLAISLALPPLTRMYFERLRELHEGIQLALQAV